MYSNRNYLQNLRPSRTILCPCPPPKKLLTSSSWITRNDSSNVDAILHPESYSPKLKFGEKIRGQVTQKHLLGRNTCYCLDGKAPKPTLFKRPNTCISYQTFGQNGLVGESDLRRRSLTCICSKDDQIEVREIPKYRQAHKNIEYIRAKTLPLQFTDQREKYEEFREKEEERFKRDVEDCREKEKSVVDDRKVDSVNTILGTQLFETETHTSRDESSASDKSEEYNKLGYSRPQLPKYHSYTVPEFRKEYYFETHDIDRGFSEIAVDHTCIHQFKLSDRWRADAVNKDVFGRSRCKVCDKVMDGTSVNLSTSYLLDNKKSGGSKIKNFAQAYTQGLAPRTITLGRGKSQIELIVNENDLARFTGFVEKNQKLQFNNSLALRHQKMRAL